MRRWAFVIAILGMFVLLLFMARGPIEVLGYEDLEGLEVNTKVEVSGEVVEERAVYENVKILVLENGIEVVCECDGKFDGKNIEVEGIVEEYDGRKQVGVLRIVVQNSYINSVIFVF